MPIIRVFKGILGVKTMAHMDKFASEMKTGFIHGTHNVRMRTPLR